MEEEDKLKEHLKRWEPFKLEFLDEKDKFYQLDSSIEHVTSECMIINPPKFADEKYDLPVNSELSIVFYRADGLLYGMTKVLGKQSSGDLKLKVSLPYDVELIERRKAKRVKLSLKLELVYYINKNSIQKKVLNEVTYDISSTGLSYISDKPFGKYHDIKAFIYLDTNFKDPVIANCNYIASRKKQIRGQEMYQVAFEFIKISREDIIRLQQKCYRSRSSLT